ncbi:4-hydroxymandelate oxidase [Thermosporothrix hazakensis]|uniref:4-hydroxymandelate oxidase n=2 Tax=Thermosporothrix TaxID=768650 RepID=A0A326USZ1_THEHA|nr:alpha-hydroxy acid oxidase [Thermosporothrix hazakensis]PZW34517.1 4-hydroxymandelate oxidase [Thermosporothrix hazakensis]BBH85640.1 alpha-hydroxy-acid oxidizing enzyme [Thermosporothrix sp. COM3]GCE45931.1 alpha-hydroxy-acid oxidizing enzyme [Thermosporothrix hazakensis]
MHFIQTSQFEEAARQKVDEAAWCYLESGCGTEQTLRANIKIFEQYWIRPRVFVPMQAPDLNTTVLGSPVSMPILAAPIGFQRWFHPEGERASAQGTGQAQTLYVASSSATTRLEDIATAATGPLWFQLYLFEERDVSAELVQRAEAAGYRAIVVTVDTPWYGRKERFARGNYSMPGTLLKANLDEHASGMVGSQYGWEVIDWLRSLTRLPILLKGVLTAEDARKALAHGVDGIIVSTHGGRQLDAALPSLLALPEVVEAVNGQIEVYFDSGIRTGTDVFKALALGARAVFVGRPLIWGLAVNGAQGVADVFAILREELEYAMMLSGCPAVSCIDRSLLREAHIL